MRKNHTPIIVKRIQRWFNRWYIDHYIRPQCDTLGQSPGILKPHTLQITGTDIHLGHFIHIISNRVQPVTLTSWRSKQHRGEIHIGDYTLLSPGVNITSADAIHIGNNCMLAAEVVISDCDWHGLYNRIRPFRCSAPVQLEDNVWIGLRAIILKGVTIGENSVVGAGSVVVNDVPANTVVAGNPAKVIKTINPQRKMLKREFLFSAENHWSAQHKIEDSFNANNTFCHWIKATLHPSKLD